MKKLITNIALASPLLLATTSSLAGEGTTRTWHVGSLPSSPVGGEYFTSLRWRDADDSWGVPGVKDLAVIDYPAVFTITFAEDATNDRVQVRAGFVTFDLSSDTLGTGREYTLLSDNTSSPSITVAVADGDSAGLNIAHGAMRGQYTDIGLGHGTFGMITLSGDEALLANEWQLRVGHFGSGMLDVSNGATVENWNATIGHGNGAFGQVDILGADSSWTCDGSLAIGRGGFGTMSVLDGGTVTSQDAIIAQQFSSFGEVTVAGSESSWLIDGSIDVGMAGVGELLVSDGGYVSNHTFASIATTASSPPGEEVQGRATVRDAGSVWDVNGNLYVGTIAVGELTVGQGGHVAATSDLFSGVYSEECTQIVLELASSYDYHKQPALDIGGIADSFPVTVNLVDGFTPQEGDVFQVIAAVAFEGQFTFDLPDLPEPLAWHVEATATTIDLHVIESIPGDLNGDGVVNVSDLLALLGAWGDCDTSCPADLNGDDIVNVSDLLLLLSHFG